VAVKRNTFFCDSKFIPNPVYKIAHARDRWHIKQGASTDSMTHKIRSWKQLRATKTNGNSRERESKLKRACGYKPVHWTPLQSSESIVVWLCLLNNIFPKLDKQLQYLENATFPLGVLVAKPAAAT
jgi:hypothetical protein